MALTWLVTYAASGFRHEISGLIAHLESGWRGRNVTVMCNHLVCAEGSLVAARRAISASFPGVLAAAAYAALSRPPGNLAWIVNKGAPAAAHLRGSAGNWLSRP
jgi:hypothetical protein